MSSGHAMKAAQVEAIRDNFSRATSAVLLNFRGLDVSSATALRAEFRKVGVDYKVVKNTLLRLAVKDTPLDTEAFTQLLVGETAIAWSYEEPSVAAKIVRDFRKDDVKAGKLHVKCAVLESAILPADRVETELASMPGKDELRGMLLAQLLAPAQSLVRQLQAPGQNLAYALDARMRQQSEGG